MLGAICGSAQSMDCADPQIAPNMCSGVYRMVDASSNHFIYFIRSTISDNTCLSAVTCMPINHLPVRKAYSFSLDENRLTNGSESSLFYSSITNSLAIR